MAQVAMRDELGADADRNFWHGLRADVDSQRRIDLGQCLVRYALGSQVVEDHLDLPLAADQAHIPRAAINQMEQRLLIMTMPAGHNQTVRVARDVQVRQHTIDRSADPPLSPRKSLLTGELGPVIDDPYVKIQI